MGLKIIATGAVIATPATPVYNAALRGWDVGDGTTWVDINADRYQPISVASVATLVTKLGFIQLLTLAERAAFIVAQAQAAALTLPFGTDATTQALVALKAFLFEFDAMGPADTIDLTNADTVAAVGVFVALEILTAPEGARVLAGTPPTS